MQPGPDGSVLRAVKKKDRSSGKGGVRNKPLWLRVHHRFEEIAKSELLNRLRAPEVGAVIFPQPGIGAIAHRGQDFMSDNLSIKWFEKVNPPTKPPNYCLD